MPAREDVVTVYTRKGIAIPYGVGSAKQFIKKPGFAVLQFPSVVPFGDELAYLVVGIAGLVEEHLPILQSLAITVYYEDHIEAIKRGTDAQFFSTT